MKPLVRTFEEHDLPLAPDFDEGGWIVPSIRILDTTIRARPFYVWLYFFRGFCQQALRSINQNAQETLSMLLPKLLTFSISFPHLVPFSIILLHYMHLTNLVMLVATLSLVYWTYELGSAEAKVSQLVSTATK